MANTAITQKCAAQSVKTINKAEQNYFDLGADIKCYQIILEQHGKEYASYYQTIREKIVQRLKKNYRYYYHDGDVNLSFVLNSNGSLNRIDVELNKSTKDKRLLDVTLMSLQQAAPFLPFPKELQASCLPFSLMISFKEKSD